MAQYKMMIAAVSLGALAIGACGTTDNTGTNGSAQQTGDDGGAAAADAGDGGAAAQCIAARRFSICSDGQTVAIASALNTAEINEAQTFASLSQNQAVKAYANQVMTDHTQVQMAAQTLLQAAGITPVTNTLAVDAAQSSKLQVQALESMAANAPAQGSQQQAGTLSAVDSAYLAHQIFVHTTNLAMLDLILIPSAQNPQLQQALIQVRVLEETELAAAIQLQTSVEASCGGSAASDAGADSGAASDGGAEAGSGAAGQ